MDPNTEFTVQRTPTLPHSTTGMHCHGHPNYTHTHTHTHTQTHPTHTHTTHNTHTRTHTHPHTPSRLRSALLRNFPVDRQRETQAIRCMTTALIEIQRG